MSLSEFEIIRKYFSRGKARRPDVIAGIGDDGAVLRVPGGQDLVVSMDTMVAGVHFPVDASAADIGYKSLAVNLSDMAAMGATPAWATLALTMPEVDESWLQAFCQGLFALADEYGVDLVGGDTTRGPLSITVQLHGLVPKGAALLRRGARPGDLVCVTGTLGDAALGLRLWSGRQDARHNQGEMLYTRLHRPTPRVREGIALRGLATSAIDISDGLAADLGHILEASQVGANIDLAYIPLSHSFRERLCDQSSGLLGTDWASLALCSGDDYELCFTLPGTNRTALDQSMALCHGAYTVIGKIVETRRLQWLDADNSEFKLPCGGYNHFAG